MATDLTSQILEALAAKEPILSSNAFPGIPSSTVKGCLDRLESRGMVAYQTLEREEAKLTDEGSGIAAEGSHEAKVFEAVRKAVDGMRISDLPVRLGGSIARPRLVAFTWVDCPNTNLQNVVGKESAKVGQGRAFKEGWVRKDREGRLVANVGEVHNIILIVFC